MECKSEIKKRKLEQYDHKGKERLNNPPVGLVTPETDKPAPKKTYQYDPHLDPQLVWAGKAEHTSFEVPVVSLHVHERIDPRTIIGAVRRGGQRREQLPLFSSPEENPPLREAIEFYKHKHNWSNRLIAGDSLLVMNSLLEKEGMSGKVQMIYIDPPYGIKYGSNFQPFVNKRDVKDGKDEDLTSELEMIKAFRDTWELGIHSYLTYMRDRLLLAKQLLHESGSIFVQISDDNVHHVREIMDEVFGSKNFVSLIPFRKKTMPLGSCYLDSMFDFLVWYSKNLSNLKYRQLYQILDIQGDFHWKWYEDKYGRVYVMSSKEINNHDLLPENIKLFRLVSMKAPGYSKENDFEITLNGKKYPPPKGGSWITGPDGMERLRQANRLFIEGNTVTYKLYFNDFPLSKITNIWSDTVGAFNKLYVVQTNEIVIQRCLLMTTDPGDLVFDPTCGSGTTAYVAEQWGRRWITCDTSRVALTLAKQRLMTAVFDYYTLAHPEEGVGGGFVYKTVPHIILKSIANNEPPAQEILYDQPFIDNSKVRVTGPFTVEAVPAPAAKSLDELQTGADLSAKALASADVSIARSGETLRQAEWRDALLNSGVRGRGGQYIRFSRVEPMSGTRYIQAEAETKPEDEKAPQRVFIVFGPEHAPMEQCQVALALDEAQSLRPKADMILFAAFQFDPEAAKDIDEVNWPGVTLLRVQMNADLFTDDLKKKRTSADSFWLLGQPDVRLKKIEEGEHKGKFQVEVKGFDYYDTKTGNVISGSDKNIAMWMLDPDYDGRSLLPRQVFFPMASDTEGWSKLAKNLKAEIDSELIEAYRGTVSLPFSAGKYKRCAVKIIDDRGTETLRIIKL
ncbi:MAG: site-specific DNA-methyltransferase [bacterium]|nr:site-specific DNA-methyltransferase [bacterium]